MMKHTLRCHDFGERHAGRSAGVRIGGESVGAPRAKIAPAHKGLRPKSPLALSLGLPIWGISAAPRFALSTILARTARAFHYVRGSMDMKDTKVPDAGNNSFLRLSFVSFVSFVV